MAGKKPSTRQQLERIPNVQNLYRHPNGTYYGIKKVDGKRKEHSLNTKDRKLAERWLKDWIEGLDKVDTTQGRMTLKDLVLKFEAASAGKSSQTRKTNASIIKKLKGTWKHGMDIRVVDVRPSHLNEWLAQHEQRLKHTTYNRYAGLLKDLFKIAVSDRIISKSPFDEVKTKWKKPQKPIRKVPTQEEFEAIIQDIRVQKFNADAEASGDFLEFIGLAGLGQAEAGSIQLEDIDWEAMRIRIRRKKTQNFFFVPIYPHLAPLLKRLSTKAKDRKSSRLLEITDGKKGLSAACKRLSLPQFSQRSLRQFLIRRLWQAGVDHKLIAKWQGHQDGGKLILDTYTELFGSNDESYERQQLKKIA